MHGGRISWFQGIILSLVEPVRSLVGWHGWNEIFLVLSTDRLSVCVEAGINLLSPCSLERPGTTRDPRLVASGQGNFSHLLWGCYKSNNVLSVIGCKKRVGRVQRTKGSELLIGFVSLGALASCPMVGG